MNIRFNVLLLFSFIIVVSCGSQPKKYTSKKVTKTTTVKKAETPKIIPNTPVVKKEDDALKVTLPEIKREFRAAWIASVANINWPSRNNLTVEQQKSEAIQLLDYLKNNNFNVAILQIRPSADALYKSNKEPWSYFLTGQIGKNPYPDYDPLEFWIEESHKRGIELHAWLNPFRAHHSNGGNVTEQSMVKKSPDNIVKLKNGMYWFDPADPKTQDHVSEVVNDLVKRYDIDAIHFDDYFYPYATYNGGKDFPDTKTWNTYQKSGGTLSRADWRRGNVNKFVERIYKEIKTEKPYVLFGISPFGIWKPGYPSGITGSSQYDELYADAKLWLNQGWVDYFTPQLYWPIDSKGQSFPLLLNWWKSENTQNRHLWPGLNTVEIKVSDKPSEIVNQIELSRQILKNDAGTAHWSIAGLIKNSSMTTALKNGPYKEEALIPKTSWIKAQPLQKPVIKYTNSAGEIVLNWTDSSTQNVFQWAVYLKYGDNWEIDIFSKNDTHKTVAKNKNGKNLNIVAIKSIDRLGNESEYFAKKIK